MTVVIAILALVLVVVVIFVISAPLRAAWRSMDSAPVDGQGEPGHNPIGRDEVASGEAEQDGAGRGEAEREEDRFELEAAREAKYREIRDTELDYRTGKLSREDFAATDGALRAEAVEILNRLTALEKAG